MIHSDSLSERHLHATALRLGIRGTQLLRRMVHALYLVEQLSVQGLTFIFKGGTCLSVLVNRIDRLSIDVDIEVDRTVTQETIESILASICQQCKVFTRWELQSRRNERAGSRHYKLFYQQDLGDATDGQEHILLDVVWTSTVHPYAAERELIHDALIIDGSPVRIVTPTVEGLLGDKLTACAPLTVGVPIDTHTEPNTSWTSNKYPEMIKQLFDVNVLIPRVVDWGAVRAAFKRTLTVQQEVFGREFNEDQVVQDLALRALAMFNQLPTLYHPDLEVAHVAGHTSLKHYLVNQSEFLFEHVKMSALRAAYVAHCLRMGVSPATSVQAQTTTTLDSVKVKLITKGLSKPLRQEAISLVRILQEAGY